MENVFTFWMYLNEFEYQNFISHLNGYDIMKNEELTIEYQGDQLDSTSKGQKYKKNYQYISRVTNQNESFLAFSDSNEFTPSQTQYFVVDNSFISIAKTNDLFGKRIKKEQLELTVQKYEWKNIFLFEFIHSPHSNSIMAIIKDINASTTVSLATTKEGIKKKDIEKVTRSIFEDILKLFQFQKIDLIIEKYISSIHELNCHEEFTKGNTYNFWILEYSQIIKYVIENKNKMESE